MLRFSVLVKGRCCSGPTRFRKLLSRGAVFWSVCLIDPTRFKKLLPRGAEVLDTKFIDHTRFEKFLPRGAEVLDTKFYRPHDIRKTSASWG